MGRPVYSYELTDPDFSWLISNFRENNPGYCLVESSCLPIVFISDEKPQKLLNDFSQMPLPDKPADLEEEEPYQK